MKVICVDNSFKPADIPNSYWIKKNNEYTVIASYNDMNGVPLYELQEIDLRELGGMYKGFAASRFKEVDNLIDELVEELNLQLEEVI